MRVSTKGRSGLRAMVELGQHFGDGPVTMHAIAERQEISLKYLHALLAALRSAGLIRSVRGSKGGYELARPPAKISVHEVLQALEGTLCPVDCARDQEACRRARRCATRPVWVGLDRAITNYLERVPLATLLPRGKAA